MPDLLTDHIAQIISLNTSPGGIPKYPRDSILITDTGLQGDGHNHAKHNNPIQAVCLQDVEKLDELCLEGYPLYPGATGENLTVRNLNVNSLTLGTELIFSSGVQLKISKVRQPCYVLDAINPKLKEDILGRCGMYAQVVNPGRVSVGDTICAVPPGESAEKNPALWPHTGAIFCGGKSRRMGQPKAGVVLPSGQTLIEHVYHIMKSLCRQVVLVGHGQGVPASLQSLPKIEDHYQGIGPIGGLEALLNSNLDSEYLIVPCDLYQLTQEALRPLLDFSLKPLVVLEHQGEIEPMIGRYLAHLLPLVRSQIAQGNFALRDVLSRADIHVVSLEDKCLAAIANANSPKDILLPAKKII